MLQVGTILWAKNRPGDHNDHLHVEPPTRKTGTPPLTNPGMTPGVQAIFDGLVVQFGPANYINTSRPGWSHMGWWNRRKIAGSQTWSQHAYANALDIGPYVGVAQQQRFYDFLTGATAPIPSGDDMTSLRLIVAEAIQKGWLGWPAEGEFWLKLCETPNDPQWRTDFEPAWNGWKLAEGQAIAAGGGPTPAHDHPHTHSVIGKTT